MIGEISDWKNRNKKKKNVYFINIRFRESELIFSVTGLLHHFTLIYICFKHVCYVMHVSPLICKLDAYMQCTFLVCDAHMLYSYLMLCMLYLMCIKLCYIIISCCVMDYLIYGLAHCLVSGKYQTLSLKTRHWQNTSQFNHISASYLNDGQHYLLIQINGWFKNGPLS